MSQDLIAITLEDHVTTRMCPCCYSPLKTCRKIAVDNVNKYFVLKIYPSTQDRRSKLPTKVKGITTSNIKIGESSYRFNCMVSHCGDLENPRIAHYISWIKKNRKWYTISDELIKPEQKWPTNGWDDLGKKSPFLLFYTKIA